MNDKFWYGLYFFTYLAVKAVLTFVEIKTLKGEEIVSVPISEIVIFQNFSVNFCILLIFIFGTIGTVVFRKFRRPN